MRAEASLDTVKRLLDDHRASFPEQFINWQKAASELAIRFLVVQYDYLGSSSEDWQAMTSTLSAYLVHQELIQLIQSLFFADPNDTTFLRYHCDEFVNPLTCGWWLDEETSH